MTEAFLRRRAVLNMNYSKQQYKGYSKKYFREGYPVEYFKYCKTVGELRVKNIARILHRFGFNVYISPVEANKCDLLMYDKDMNINGVMEITNWNSKIRMQTYRKNCIINNLSSFNCNKFLVVSFKYNVKHYLEDFESNNIHVIPIGFQTQLMEWYEYFREYGRHYDKRPLNEKTDRIVTKIFAYYICKYYYNNSGFKERGLIWGDKNVNCEKKKAKIRALWSLTSKDIEDIFKHIEQKKKLLELKKSELIHYTPMWDTNHVGDEDYALPLDEIEEDSLLDFDMYLKKLKGKWIEV